MKDIFGHGKHIDENLKQCIYIYEKVFEEAVKCKDAADTKNNIVPVFMNNIIKYLTAYVFLRNEQNSPFQLDDEEVLNYQTKNPPYISYKDIADGINPDKKNYEPRWFIETKKIKIVRKLSVFLSFLTGKSKIAFSPVLSVDPGILKTLLKKGFGLIQIKKEKLYAEDIELQLENIKSLIDRICDSLEIDQKDNLCKMIISFIKENITEHKPLKYADIFLLGPMSRTEHNIAAANAKYNGCKVITVSHGEGDQQVFEEPRFVYAEMSYPDYFFGYGPCIGLEYKDKIYTKPLFREPKPVPSNSNIIKKIYNGRNVRSFTGIDNFTVMYVPDSTSYNEKYGPFAFTFDRAYINFQMEIVRQLQPEYIKRHPKGHEIFRNSEQQEIEFIKKEKLKTEIITENFMTAYEKVDIYIFDIVSTAFMVAAATDKPIIYFNTGRRNFTKHAEKMIRERCVWIDINLEEINDLYSMVKESAGKELINNFTEAYSVNTDDDMSREERLIILLEGVDKDEL